MLNADLKMYVKVIPEMRPCNWKATVAIGFCLQFGSVHVQHKFVVRSETIIWC